MTRTCTSAILLLSNNLVAFGLVFIELAPYFSHVLATRLPVQEVNGYERPHRYAKVPA